MSRKPNNFFGNSFLETGFMTLVITFMSQQNIVCLQSILKQMFFKYKGYYFNYKSKQV